MGYLSILLWGYLGSIMVKGIKVAVLDSLATFVRALSPTKVKCFYF